MKTKRRFLLVCLALVVAGFVRPALAQRQMENLGRGIVVLHKSSTQAYVSWRLLATDPPDLGFNVYRVANGGAAVKLNSQPVTNTTDFLDTTANFTVTNYWYVTTVSNGVEGAAGAPWGLAANAAVRQYFSVPLQATGGSAAPYDVKFCWVGDIDGDGEYDFVVDRMSTTVATNEYLQAYKRDGTLLWQMNMGYNSTNQYNIEPGASAISIGDKDNVTVYDLDGDGRAEVCVRTARGVTLPDGTVITGPDDTTQYLSILDGMTGHELARATITNLWPADGPLNCHFAIMYCDGVHPSILVEGENRNAASVFQRETMVYDYRNGALTRRWFFTPPANSNLAWGHQIRISDVNHDGIDDLIEVGSVRNGADGSTLFDTELVHGDRYHTGDFDPDRPGLETYSIQQLNSTLLATMLYEAGTGKIIKKWYGPTVADVGRGDALDFDPRTKGVELFSTQPGIYDCKGNTISTSGQPFPTLGIWWDADLQREMFSAADGNGYNPVINKWNYATLSAGRMYSIYSEGVHTAYGGRPAFWGDILGDWREEFIVVANDYSAIRIYSTTIQATNRLYCLMQNPEYRDQCTAKGYYQASYPDYYLGDQMQPPAIAPVSNARLTWRGNAGANWDAASTANWFTNNLWISNTIATTFNPGDTVLFDISGSNNNVNLAGSIQPGAVTVHSPKDYSFNGGSLDGAMTLTKAGAGRLILNNTNNYTGKTLICESPFLVNGSLPNSPVTIRGGVWLDGRLGGSGVVGAPVSCEPGGGVSPGQGANSPGTLTIANSLQLNGALNDFDLSDDPTGTVKTNDLLNITGSLTLLGTNTLTIHKLNSTLPPGVYPLINYSGSLNGTLANLTVAGLDGTPLALTNPPGQIALVVKSVRTPANLVWNGGLNGNAWDLVTTSNFLNGAAQDFFVPQDNVQFTDTGGANGNVNLSATLLAATVTVNSTSNYLFSGGGGISGATGLTKTNTGTLVINNDNYYTGRTLLGGGVLEVNDLAVANAPGPLGSAPNTSPTNLVLYNGATLRINSTQAYTDRGTTLQPGTDTFDVPTYGALVNFSGLITGSGTLQKIGQGTLILGTSNNFSGGAIIKAGVLQLATETGNTYGVGTGTVTLDGGILKMLDDSSTYSTMSYNIAVPTNSTGELDCDSRIDCYGTLTGGGTLKMSIPFVRTTLYGNWSAFTGKILVLPGISGDPRTGGSGTNGDFRISNSYGYGNAAVYLTNWMYAYHTTANTAVAIGELSGEANSFLTAGAWSVGGKNTDATFAGHITGNSVTKVGTGAWTLTGSNYYTGTTVVNGGKLLVNGDNHSATGAVTVNSAGALGGTGIVGGAATINGKLIPGPASGLGTLSFSNNLTLAAASTTTIGISKSPKANSFLAVRANLALNGALTVTNISGALTNGDTFTLFSAGGVSGNFTGVTLPPLSAGLAWNKTALATAGAISVVAVSPQLTNVVFDGTNFSFSGGGGYAGLTYYVVASTNVSLPSTNWTPVFTNIFDAGGNFSYTAAIGTNPPQRFFRLLVP